MRFEATNTDRKKQDLLNRINEIKDNQAQIELELKERWSEVKDFVGGNDFYKAKRFATWKKNTYDKEVVSLNRKLKNAIKAHDEL